MKLTLKDFQEDVLSTLQSRSRLAAASATEEAQALVLAAPTGSGKTVIATAWMERLLEGDEEHAPDPEATFLWLTDQPELNEQTRRKMLSGSSVLGSDDLITIDASYDTESLSPGKVYFLNSQKLGKDKQLVTKGDKRAHSIWETIANTAAQRPQSFWLVIDEAHKGMVESNAAREAAATIVQKFVKGSPGELPVLPLVFGISATPERFQTLIGGTDRTVRTVTVDPESVRSSGLLKDAITLYHPSETQPSDLTLLRAAADQVKRYSKRWEDYSDKEQAPSVRPILVVQVEDASAKKATKTDVAAVITELEASLGPLNDAGIAHSFQEGTPLVLGDDRRVRYIAPSDIQDDQDLRVVLFKRSLSTGWDCPRAEVMMSFRRAVDQTLIAQLVGRMVRTPLARAVSGSEFLNSVSLYLPYYDEAALNSVVEYLTQPDPDIGFPTRVRRGADLIELKRNTTLGAAFDAAAGLMTYRVQKVAKQSPIRRLLKLGRLLAWDKLDPAAGATYTDELVAVLLKAHEEVADSDEFKDRLEEAARIDVRGVTVAYGTTKQSVSTSTLKAVASNVEHAFAEAGRKLGGGLHAAYLQARAAEHGAPPVSTIKLELYALLEDASVQVLVEQRATTLLDGELEKHKVAVRDQLPDERRQLYRLIRMQSGKPSAEPWELPDTIEGSKSGNADFERHLYVTDKGKYPAALNQWEQDVLTEALADAAAIGWLRNEPRKEWSLAVPYEHGKDIRPMYPDFVIFREQGGGVVCDVLEPHALAYEDSAAKAKGLAAFARDHGDEFGRIRLIAKVGQTYKALALDDIATRDQVLAVATNDHLKQLVEAA